MAKYIECSLLYCNNRWCDIFASALDYVSSIWNVDCVYKLLLNQNATSTFVSGMYILAFPFSYWTLLIGEITTLVISRITNSTTMSLISDGHNDYNRMSLTKGKLYSYFSFVEVRLSPLFNSFFTLKPAICRKNIICVSDLYSLRWPITSNVVHDVGLSTVYHRIYRRNFLTSDVTFYSQVH